MNLKRALNGSLNILKLIFGGQVINGHMIHLKRLDAIYRPPADRYARFHRIENYIITEHEFVNP
jgi:hypothetical protein